MMSCAYLCECDWLVFGNVICILACEHSTVTAIHLLWDFLKREIEILLNMSADNYDHHKNAILLC